MLLPASTPSIPYLQKERKRKKDRKKLNKNMKSVSVILSDAALIDESLVVREWYSSNFFLSDNYQY